ncbi:OmpA family protein [Azospirillum sp. B4]|uniref:OmpA family protein n=1 Tax=Azospirillum sp. B4 TaxID=95605 RepID=UPI000A04AB79|nr:OmpA family protein [Azospirillum sp. B4]
MRDLARVVDFVSIAGVRPDKLLLIGFADSRGRPEMNDTLSKQRARAVADALGQQGVRVGLTTWLGADMPVADNGTEEGREKNRRVEIYVRP